MQKQPLKSAVKQLLPHALVEQKRRLGRYLRQKRDAGRSRAEVFSEIYANNLWGGESGEFCSGEGSRYEQNKSYCDYVSAFMRTQGIEKVVDIGCGDFQISRYIADPSVDYHGVDVVGPLVERNNREFGAERIRFSCLDVVGDELPDGDLVLIREVLQHLSNAEIALILRKIEKYRYAIITEYQPAPNVLTTPNLDKAHGMDTRIWEGSGVYLEHAPFERRDAPVVVEIAADTEIVGPGERMVSYLLRNDKAVS